MASPAHTFTLGLVQLRWEEGASTNLERALNAVRRAGNNGAQIVCLPELFALPHFAHREEAPFELAEAVGGPTCQRLADAARQAGAVVAGSIFECRAPGLYHSTAVLFDADGALLGSYRKMHLVGGEKFAFAPGDGGFRTFATRFGRVGLLLSWDQWFPEAARALALQGAEVVLGLSALGSPVAEDVAAERAAWEVMQQSHAIANGLFVAGVNRVGQEGGDEGITFWGSSSVWGPLGGVLGRGSEDREEVLVVPCDRRLLEDVRRAWPWFRDRRPDAYGDLARRWVD